jgi:hypothetical protein
MPGGKIVNAITRGRLMREFQKWWDVFHLRYNELKNPFLLSIVKEFCYQAWTASRDAQAVEGKCDTQS